MRVVRLVGRTKGSAIACVWRTCRLGVVLLALGPQWAAARVVGLPWDWKSTIYVAGEAESQNLIRHPRPNELQFVQQRNTLRLLLDWSWLERNDRWLGLFDLSSVVEQSSVFVLFRGVYDSVYDSTPDTSTRHDFRGISVPPGQRSIGDIPTALRRAERFDNQFRAAYVDVRFRGGVKVRAGRQQLVWGESDGFRLLDRVNTLDLSWHSYQQLPPTDTSFDEIRIPFWMLVARKDGLFQWDHGFAEAYWNPGDWRPNKVASLPQPWGLKAVDPLVLPGTGGVQRLANGTRAFRQGDYDRNPAENSQVGLRLGRDRRLCANWRDCRWQWQVAYLHQRFAPWGGASTSAAPFFAVPGPAPKGGLRLEYDSPYINTVGGALNYLLLPLNHGRGDTSFVIRSETTYDFRIPYYDCRRGAGGSTALCGGRIGNQVPGTRALDIWSTLLGFDFEWRDRRRRRLTLTGQLFSSFLPGSLAGTVGSLGLPASFVRDVRSRNLIGPTDDVRRWELLGTVGLGGWMLGGRVRPSMIYLLDMVNSYSQEVAWAVHFQATRRLGLEIAQRFLINPTHKVNLEPWGLGGLNSGRSETGIRIVVDLFEL